jgi:ABC-type molybdate transport system substrate-binding protein
VARQYAAECAQEVRLQYGGSGTLLSNLRVTQRGDLYLAADELFVQQAREQGLVAAVVRLARIRPVIAVQKGNPKQIRSAEDLLRPGVHVRFVLFTTWVSVNRREVSVASEELRMLSKAAPTSWSVNASSR